MQVLTHLQTHQALPHVKFVQTVIIVPIKRITHRRHVQPAHPQRTATTTLSVVRDVNLATTPISRAQPHARLVSKGIIAPIHVCHQSFAR